MLVLATSLPFFLLFFLYKTKTKIVTCTNNLGKTQFFYLDCSCISMEVLPTSLTFLFFFSLQNKYCNLTKIRKNRHLPSHTCNTRGHSLGLYFTFSWGLCFTFSWGLLCIFCPPPMIIFSKGCINNIFASSCNMS